MNREEIVGVLEQAGQIGTVHHKDYADYVQPISQRKKINDEWVNVEAPYMSVDGRIKMANDDHKNQDGNLVYHTPVVVENTPERVTLLVQIESSVYGIRHGYASSRIVGGKGPEREFPFEVAETSAIGRALGYFGYGLLPGSGIPTAEEISRVEGFSESRRPAQASRQTYARQERSYTAPQPEPEAPSLPLVDPIDGKPVPEGTPNRPMSGAQLKVYFQASQQQFKGESTSAATLSSMQKLAGVWLTKLAGERDRAGDFLKAFFPSSGGRTDNLNYAQVKTLIEWMGIYKPEGARLWEAGENTDLAIMELEVALVNLQMQKEGVAA